MSIPLVRKLLRENPDGMTARQLAIEIYRDDGRQSAVNKSLAAMADAYRDRYIKSGPEGRSKFAAVWCVVEVPEHCPHPVREAA